ncbi:UbiA family prenyltransferase [Actinomadura verrucosospora]|nr:UbiA family prenyltransferase [Actinomadura verrucosospora]
MTALLIETSPPPLRAFRLTLREARPVVQVAYALRCLVGLRLAWSGRSTVLHAAAVLVCWVAVCVAVYALNGVSDVDADRRNHPSRPIARGDLSAGQVRRAAGWLIAVGLAAAAVAGPALIPVFAAMLAVGVAYSFGPWPLKNTVPGLVFSGTALGALSYLAGWLGGGGGAPTAEAVVCCGGLALWMGLAGTLTKDLADVSGDRLTGRRTLPILVGEERARRIAAAGAVAYAALFVALAAWLAPGHLLTALAVMAGALGVAGQCLATPGQIGRNAYRTFMIAQYAGNALMLE